MKIRLLFQLLSIYSFLSGSNLRTISGDITQIDNSYLRSCPEVVDSCIFACDDASTNPCHPENIFTINVDTIPGITDSEGSRYRIYFPREYNGMNATKFKVTASWPCLSPTYVAASGNYTFWDVIGNDDCPGTVQGSIWYGDDCQDDNGNIGSPDCEELIGRFCFAVGDTLNWSENSDQSIKNDICDGCWMSVPAWGDYDSELYSDTLLSPLVCNIYDHCHHSTPSNILCGQGYMDSELSVGKNNYILNNFHFKNYPNPFNPVTTIKYTLSKDQKVYITIYDMLGRVINNLVAGKQKAGIKSTQWDGTNNSGERVSAGVYLYQIRTERFTKTKKMVFLQ